MLKVLRRPSRDLLTTTILGLYIFISFIACVVEEGGNHDAPPLAITSNIPLNTDGLPEGEAGEEYTFRFRYNATTAPDSFGLETVKFSWVFGDGSSAGEYMAGVEGDFATHEIRHTYRSNGRFGLVVSVADDNGDTLATADYIVGIGEPEVFKEDLDICDQWKAGTSGGYGVTVIEWDISEIPSGRPFDLGFEAYSVPDKFIVEYPPGNIVLDTGWRGSESYDGSSLYPGGVTAPGNEKVEDLFRKGSSNKFVMTVIGPDQNTGWDYKVRCRN